MLHDVVTAELPTLTDTLARRLEQSAREALEARGRVAVALAGGSVATAFFPRLARAAVDWSRTDFFWADERAVPPTDPESNYALARTLWLAPAAVPAARIHRLPADTDDLEEAAAAAGDELVHVLGAPPRLDLALLGMGEDGHVASLFPGHALLEEDGRWVAAVEDAPKPPPRRLTLTLPALAAAHLVVVAALGTGKAPAVQDALTNPASRSPLGLLARRAPAMLFLLDPAAGALLPPS